MIVGSTDARVYGLDRIDGTQRWSQRTDGPMYASHAVGEQIYVTNENGTVMALSPEGGEVLWDTPLDDPIVTSPAVSYGTIFLADETGTI